MTGGPLGICEDRVERLGHLCFESYADAVVLVGEDQDLLEEGLVKQAPDVLGGAQVGGVGVGGQVEREPEVALDDLPLLVGGVELGLERFVSAITAIGGPTAEVLGDSLCLTERTWEVDSLKERRKIYGLLQEPKIQPEAVADRAEAAIDELVAVLVNGRYPKSPIPTKIAESHRASPSTAWGST